MKLRKTTYRTSVEASAQKIEISGVNLMRKQMIPCKSIVSLDVYSTQDHAVTLYWTRDMISDVPDFPVYMCGTHHTSGWLLIMPSSPCRNHFEV